MKKTGLLRRFAAMFYDGLLLAAVLMLTATPFVAARGGEAVPPLTDFAYRLTLAAVILVFFVGFWTRTGRTLGMQSWRLQLETATGDQPTLGAAVVRFFAALLSWAPAGLGFFWQLWDKDDLTWHDRLSKTRIVYYPKDSSAEEST